MSTEARSVRSKSVSPSLERRSSPPEANENLLDFPREAAGALEATDLPRPVKNFSKSHVPASWTEGLLPRAPFREPDPSNVDPPLVRAGGERLGAADANPGGGARLFSRLCDPPTGGWVWPLRRGGCERGCREDVGCPDPNENSEPCSVSGRRPLGRSLGGPVGGGGLGLGLELGLGTGGDSTRIFRPSGPGRDIVAIRKAISETRGASVSLCVGETLPLLPLSFRAFRGSSSSSPRGII